VHDANHFTPLGWNYGSSYDNGNVSHLVVVDPLDVNESPRSGYNTSVDKASSSYLTVGRHGVPYVAHVNFADVCLSCDLYLIACWPFVIPCLARGHHTLQVSCRQPGCLFLEFYNRVVDLDPCCVLFTSACIFFGYSGLGYIHITPHAEIVNMSLEVFESGHVVQVGLAMWGTSRPWLKDGALGVGGQCVPYALHSGVKGFPLVELESAVFSSMVLFMPSEK
jgi:hypothetical protein